MALGSRAHQLIGNTLRRTVVREPSWVPGERLSLRDRTGTVTALFLYGILTQAMGLTVDWARRRMKLSCP